jgi:hypothetical protein
MNLATLNNQFHFQLPIGFVPESLEDRYMKLLNDARKPYRTVLDYLNSTIQSINFPSIEFPVTSNPQNKLRKQITWKTVGNIYDQFDKNVTITFLDVDSKLNYFIILDILCNHYLNSEQPYDNSIIVTVVNERRRALYNIQFRSVIWTGLDGNQLAFNDAILSSKTFNATFAFNYIDFEFVNENKDMITNKKYGEN